MNGTARADRLACRSRKGALPICEAFISAAEQLGIPRNDDLTSAGSDRFRLLPAHPAHVRRSSTSVAYLKPAMGRPNLTVMLAEMVERVVVDGSGRPVSRSGAMATSNRSTRRARLSFPSGAIGSPRLLMLSGIGPADHLKSVGIAPVHDLPGVGSNLQDHLDLCVLSECTGDHSYDKYGKPHWAALAGLRYLLTRTGPVASSLFETGGFWKADPNAPSPDIQFHFGLGTGIEAGIAKAEERRHHAQRRIPAPALARHGAAGERRSGGGTADRSQLLGRQL